MTASQVAQHFSAKKISKGKWIARCTAHPDKKPSLTIAEGKTGVLLSCNSQRCNFLDIVRSAGLKPIMLRYDYDPNEPSGRDLIKQLKAKHDADKIIEQIQRQEDIRMILNAKPQPRTPDAFELDLAKFEPVQ